MNVATDHATLVPVVFIGHGSPTNALGDNPYARAWSEIAAALPRPRAILCVSAHWQTDGPRVTAMAQPQTIHDFYGFPPELYAMRYPAPGSPELAQRVRDLVRGYTVQPDDEWGLDHGAWAVLCRMFPAADIPVVQLSLDRTLAPAGHYALARELLPLRREGVLVIASGNIVHNLGRVVWADEAFDWAVEFDERMAAAISARDHACVMRYEQLGPSAGLAVPTSEHFLPLLYTLALQQPHESERFFTAAVTMGALSMRSLLIA
jgi:4,5-DOPA dioxygenase extradiol